MAWLTQKAFLNLDKSVNLAEYKKEIFYPLCKFPRLWNREGSVRTRMLNSSQLSCDGFPRPSVCSVISPDLEPFPLSAKNTDLVLILLRLILT